jgi:hypothetical protein
MKEFIKQKAIAIPFYKNTNLVIVIFIVACALFYVYFANVAVRKVTLLQKTREDMQVLSVKVSELESSRFAIENSISAEKAKHFGFTEVANPTFIIRGRSNNSLSFNH